MKAFVVREPGDVALREWVAPKEVEGEVLVTPLLGGVCGTDLELIDGSIDASYVRYPLVLGHEWVGRLEADVAGVGPVGTRVVVEGIIPCGECDACLRGASNLCEQYDEIGFTRPGALAEHVSVPTGLVHALDAGVALDDAVLVEPMAVVWRALTRVPLRRGLRVGVIGDGTIALLAAYLVRLFDPSSVTVIGRRAEQRDLASSAGADEFLVRTPDASFDLVIEAAGTGAAVTSAVERCARGGMVILLGLPPHGTSVALAPDHLVNNDVIIQGSFSYTRSAFADVVERVNSGALRPSFLITHRYTLDDAPAAVEALRGNVSTDEPRGKVVIDLSAS
ncbi:MAG TPA: alcohol dehydrogenase catalytic domain-containing protein [Acidimicrobiales bacterium]|nr:alcohol dehydrogenase catalytic domain-containing protein [Acidimicrobiales bacterium]